MVSPVVLLCLSSMSQSEAPHYRETVVRSLHLKTNIPGPSKTQFIIHINGQRLDEVDSSQSTDLTSKLRRGLNVVDVRYSARGGKFSLFHPSTLELFSGKGKEARKLMSIRANDDNPRGSYRLTLRLEPSTRR